MKLLSAAKCFAVFMLFALSTFSNLKAQNTSVNPNKFVQFYVIGISSLSESRAIDNYIKTQNGVIMSRTDHRSRILFCIFDNNSNIDETTFINWLGGLGFQISCFRVGKHGIDKVYSKEGYLCD
jgi:hypothetical protein